MISVCGPNDATDAEYQLAQDVGACIARAGHALVCGGRGGVMEAAASGVKSAGGFTIGILWKNAAGVRSSASTSMTARTRLQSTPRTEESSGSVQGDGCM
jgi:uncharacterized protein (TIGR00725 family)